MAVLSFHPVKSITTAEGGAVLTNNEKFAESLGPVCQTWGNEGYGVNEWRESWALVLPTDNPGLQLQVE